MAGWVGPMIAISVLVIAFCYIAIGLALGRAMRAAMKRSEAVEHELSALRRELAPTLASFQRLADSSLAIADDARGEVAQIVDGVRRVRIDVEAGINRTRQRLADFEAMIDVVQEEVEDTALDVAAAIHTARSGMGIVGQLRRLVRPRTRRRRR
jgi:uncharacterized protein YoxC